MEEAVWGVGIGVAEDVVGEVGEDGVGLTVLEKSTGDFAGLVRTEEEGLVLSSGFAVFV